MRAPWVTGFTHNEVAYDQSFGYDNLDRLIGWTSNSSSQSYSYDPTSNRTNLGIGGNSYPYTVAPTSNRLTQTDGPGGVKMFGFDAAGNTTSAGAQTFGYDARGRMVSGNTALGTVNYQVNALGQRVVKQLPEGTTVFHYDWDGRIIAESDVAGQTMREYVWLGTTPVAVIQANTPYFIHPDHLDTPRVVTNQANTIVWRWDSDPFGTTPPNEDPDNDGQSFVFNLRFPGQYFDKETNLHYNYFRDYDPQTGRYVQSDLIGLEGGSNTYAYLDNNPLSSTDATGEIAIAAPAILPIINVARTAIQFAVRALARPAAAAAGAAAVAVSTSQDCPPPCDPPEGTRCYLGPHLPSLGERPHGPLEGAHYNIYEMQRVRGGGNECIWKRVADRRGGTVDKVPSDLRYCQTYPSFVKQMPTRY